MRYEPAETPLRMNVRLAIRIEQKKALLDTFRPLRPTILQRLHEDLRIRLTYQSNAIEGNTLNLNETQLVVEEGVTIGGHSLREHLEATNHAEAYDEVRRIVDGHIPITVETILSLHALVLKSLNPTAGQFRLTPVYIRGRDLDLPHWTEVPTMMEQWVEWLNRESRQYDPVTRAALAHHGFVAVHPFEDGNGRTGRLLLNLLLIRDGYAPALVLRSWAERYRSALAAADRERYNPIINLLGQAVEAGLDFYLEACNASPDEQYQSLSDLARAAGRDPNYLGLLVRQGKLEAVRRRGRWYSTAEALARYDQQVQQGLQQRGRPRHTLSSPEQSSRQEPETPR